MDYLLNGDDIEELAGEHTKIMVYTDLYKYKRIEDLFKNGIKAIVLLYLQDKTGNNMSGHWVTLIKRDDVIEFFDSYSFMPDSEIKWNNKEKRIELNQDTNYLTKLLYDWTLRGGKVEYNEMKFQKKSEDISTCGRIAGIRARFADIPLKKFQQIFKNMRKNGFDLDELSVDVSNMIAGRRLEG